MTYTLKDVKHMIGKITTPHEQVAAIMSTVGGFHPDDEAATIIVGSTGESLFDSAAALFVDEILDRAFEINSDRLYDIALKNS